MTTEKHQPDLSAAKTANSFTLIELLVVIAIIAILAAMLLPSLARAKIQGRTTACISNVKQLETAWTMYAGDFQDRMVPNWLGSPVAWVNGALGNESQATNATNTFVLQSGMLWPYNPSLGIYQCPGQTAGRLIDGVPVTLARNYSICSRMGSANDPDPNGASSGSNSYSLYSKMNQIVYPPPSQAIVFVCESENSIDDGYFAVATNIYEWQNSPTIVHSRGGVFSFADGHVERWQWTGLNTEQPIDTLVATPPSGPGQVGSSSANDYQRVQNAVFNAAFMQ